MSLILIGSLLSLSYKQLLVPGIEYVHVSGSTTDQAKTQVQD